MCRNIIFELGFGYMTEFLQWCMIDRCLPRAGAARWPSQTIPESPKGQIRPDKQRPPTIC
eukprot:scaffold175559_cov48-Prasinocladus_malaysianus.AAC.1